MGPRLGAGCPSAPARIPAAAPPPAAPNNPPSLLLPARAPRPERRASAADAAAPRHIGTVRSEVHGVHTIVCLLPAAEQRFLKASLASAAAVPPQEPLLGSSLACLAPLAHVASCTPEPALRGAGLCPTLRRCLPTPRRCSWRASARHETSALMSPRASPPAAAMAQFTALLWRALHFPERQSCRALNPQCVTLQVS